MSNPPEPCRQWARIGPSLSILGAVALITIVFLGSTYLVGKDREDRKLFLKNYRPPNDYEAHSRYTMRYALDSSENNDVIFLGDSTCLVALRTLDFQRLTGLKAYNLGTVGVLGIEGFDLIFRAYLQHHPKPRLLVFSISPLSFVARLPELGPMEVRDRFFWSFGPEGMATRPPHDDPLSYHVREGCQDILGRISGGLARYAVEPIPHRGDDTLESLSKSLDENRGFWSHPGALDAASRRRGSGLTSVDNRLNIDFADPFPVARENRDQFRTLARYALEHNVPVMVRLTPVLVAQAPEHYNQLQAALAGLKEELPGLIISHPEVLRFAPDEFGETNHVNKRGAERFTALAAREVSKVLPIANSDAARDPSKRERWPSTRESRWTIKPDNVTGDSSGSSR